MAGRRPHILLFDLGGVLVENVMFEELPAILPQPVDDGELRRRWLYSPSVQAYERGEMTTQTFASAFVSEWELEVTATEFLQNFTAWPRGPFPGALDLLDRLAADFRLAVLSNCNPVHWDRVAPFRQRVEAAFSSHILGLVKPDPSAFRRVAEALNADPSSIWFFDDASPNIAAARSVGMGASLTRGVQDVERALLSLPSA